MYSTEKLVTDQQFAEVCSQYYGKARSEVQAKSFEPLLKDMRARDINLNTCIVDGSPIIFKALTTHSPALLSFFIHNGATIKVVDKLGNTPLQVANRLMGIATHLDIAEQLFGGMHVANTAKLTGTEVKNIVVNLQILEAQTKLNGLFKNPANLNEQVKRALIHFGESQGGVLV